MSDLTLPSSGFVKQAHRDMRNHKPAPYKGRSGRLQFSPFLATDAADFAQLVSDPDVQKTDLCFHGPMAYEQAQEIMLSYQDAWDNQTALFFAIRLKKTAQLLGSISFVMTPEYERAELGFWIGRPFWNQGYGTEAARALLGFGFIDLNLFRIHAQHLSHNHASGQIMRKIGMHYEGCLRQHVNRDQHWYDMHQYGLLRSEYAAYTALQLRRLALN